LIANKKSYSASVKSIVFEKGAELA